MMLQIFLLLSLLINMTQCFYFDVTVYKQANGRGRWQALSGTECRPVDAALDGAIRSITMHSSCVKLWTQPNCKGKPVISHIFFYWGNLVISHTFFVLF